MSRIKHSTHHIKLHYFFIATFILLWLHPSFSQKIKLTTFPNDYVYVFEESNKDSISNFIIHNIAILNTGQSSFRLENLSVSFYNKGTVFQQNSFTYNDVLSSNQLLYSLQENKLLDTYDFMFRTKDFLENTKLTNSRDIKSRSAVVLRKLFFTSFKNPDSIKIIATGWVQGKKAAASKLLMAKKHQSPNRYIFPVAGNWFIHAGPSAHTHHRWAYMEEFAYDIARIGENNSTYKDDYKVLTNYYCYGKDVLAVEEGHVEEILDGIDEAEIYPKDLAQDAYMQLLRKRQNELIEKYGVAGAGGNYIVIKHANNEYSFYGHLKKGSVKVKQGDAIQKGRVIAAIGNSGNSTEPHLHFQLNEGKDVLRSRSLPIRFTNINWSESFEPEGSYLKSGELIQTK